jgi:hypothetical protein
VPLAAVLLVLPACGDDDVEYLAHGESGLYFTFPEHWTLYDEDALFGDGGPARSGDESPQEVEAVRATVFAVAFDADPAPSLEHVGGISATDAPTGTVLVQDLPPSQRDDLSIAALQSGALPIDGLPSERRQVLLEEHVESGGAYGTHRIANVQLDDGTWVTFDQTTMVDPLAPRAYSLVIRCEATCYERERGDIEVVTGSWTIDP